MAAVLEQQRRAVVEVLESFARAKPLGDVRFETVFDWEKDRYQVMAIGWLGKERLHDCVAHIDLRDGLILLEADNSDYGLAERLKRLGIPGEQIIFAFSESSPSAA